jgi:two-component system OmpR family sensor kinase
MMETGVRPPRNLNRDVPAPGRPAIYSLRGRLLGFVLVAILLAAVLQGLSVYRGALQQADALMDQQLQQVARSLSRGVAANSPTGWELDPDGFDLFVQIWGSDGTQLFRSTRSFLPPMAVLGFSDVQANGNRYRVFSLQAGSQTVQIAQDLSARSARAQALALRALLPFVLLTPVLMLSVWWVISRSLAPLERARREVAHRAADDFSALES